MLDINEHLFYNIIKIFFLNGFRRNGIMTVKEYLDQAYYLDKMIECKLRLSESLGRQALRFGNAENVEGETDTYTKIRALEAEIDADIDRLVDIKKGIYELTEKVGDLRQRMLLQLRYLRIVKGRRMTWADIALYLGYDERWIMRLHRAALASAEKLYKETEPEKPSPTHVRT